MPQSSYRLEPLTRCTHSERERVRLRRRMKRTESRLRGKNVISDDFPYDRIAPSIPPAPLRSCSSGDYKLRILGCYDTQDLKMPKHRRKVRSRDLENRILIKRRVLKIPLPLPPPPEDILADTYFYSTPFERTPSQSCGSTSEAFSGDTDGSPNLKKILHVPVHDSLTTPNKVVLQSRKRIRDDSAELSEIGARPMKRRRKLTRNHRLKRTDVPPAIEIDGDLEYEIETILDSKIDRRRAVPLVYLVKWLGYSGTTEESSWLIAPELKNAKELVRDFHQAHPNKPGPDWQSMIGR